LDFCASGTFAGQDLPEALFSGYLKDKLPEGFDSATESIEASGAWFLTTSSGLSSGKPRNNLALRFDSILDRSAGGAGLGFLIERYHGSVALMFYLVDPDLNNAVVFQKTSPSGALTPTRDATGGSVGGSVAPSSLQPHC